jgi:GNAT superfamily N-acetyltransferase
VGLSPHLESGLLLDTWDQTPPLHTAYNPPYLPEITGSTALPGKQSRLYELEIPPEPPAGVGSPVEIQPLVPCSLSEDLLTLFSSCFTDEDEIPPADAEESAFLLRWISSWPLIAWTALRDAQPVGFMILGPDLAPQLKRARGGRNPIRQAWLRLANRFSVRQGRIYFAGVLPNWRRQGIGRRMLNQAVHTAQDNGWSKITIGPVQEDSDAARFLKGAGARPSQSYEIYRWEL